MELLKKANGNFPRTEEQKQQMIKEAAKHYGAFLTALGFDWQADENSRETPIRVAKSWINDIVSGCVNDSPKITSFPNESAYPGMVVQTFIPIHSLCSHHNLPIVGYGHVAYIPALNSQVIGLSKLNRITDFYAKRPQLQEALTKQIHDAIDYHTKGNRGVAVSIQAQHFCTCHRGLYHNSVMSTMEVSGFFFTNELNSKDEFLKHIELNHKLTH